LRFWESALTTVVACGGAGAFIDFYIGRAGQRRIRDWLETWWLRLSYVKWSNFGREEALFAVQVMDRLFGRRFLSVRRLIAVVASTFVVSGFMIVSMMLIVMPHPILYYLSWAATVLGSFVIVVFLQRSNLLFFVLVLLSFA
jgi:hypothetical protein